MFNERKVTKVKSVVEKILGSIHAYLLSFCYQLLISPESFSLFRYYFWNIWQNMSSWTKIKEIFCSLKEFIKKFKNLWFGTNLRSVAKSTQKGEPFKEKVRSQICIMINTCFTFGCEWTKFWWDGTIFLAWAKILFFMLLLSCYTL